MLTQLSEIPFSSIHGIKVGHAQDEAALTGCTVVLCEEGATAGVDVRGGAPGTRETDLLRPDALVQQIHAVLLSGGSAFGLDAAAGVMAYLEEKGIGFDVGVARVPIVCAAILFDLAIGDARTRPDREMGLEACRSASRLEARQGNIGAGMGATVGKVLGPSRAMKSGLGSYAVSCQGLQVGALVAVNALGDIIDPETGEKLAGTRAAEGVALLDSEELLLAAAFQKRNYFSGNTTIGVIATNARLHKAQAQKVAGMAHDGLARAQRPAHTQLDGDTLFAVATAAVDADVNAVGLLAARVTARAICRAVTQARGVAGMPAHGDIIVSRKKQSGLRKG